MASKLSFYLVLILTLAGCATRYEGVSESAWDQLKDGEADAALKVYAEKVADKNESLLRLMDEGIILRTKGDYLESNKRFFEADRIIQQNGYLSLSEQVVTLLTNEKQTFYQGEDFEKVLIHVYLALNFIALQKYESALVEARRVNEILFQLISKGKRPYQKNAFAEYLSGLLFEQDGDWNNALVSYKKTLEAEPALATRFTPLGVDLLRMSDRLQILGDLENFEKKFNSDQKKLAKNSLKERRASVIWIAEMGKSPRKISTKEKHLKADGRGGAVEVLLPVPQYKSRAASAVRAEIVGENLSEALIPQFDVETTARSHLSDRMGREIAKALATAATKIGVGVAVAKATNNSDLGVLTGLLLMLASDADTRSWLLLPQKFAVSRIYLKPGKHHLTLHFKNSAGKIISSEKQNVDLKPNQLVILQSRSWE